MAPIDIDPVGLGHGHPAHEQASSLDATIALLLVYLFYILVLTTCYLLYYLYRLSRRTPDRTAYGDHWSPTRPSYNPSIFITSASSCASSITSLESNYEDALSESVQSDREGYADDENSDGDEESGLLGNGDERNYRTMLG